MTQNVKLVSPEMVESLVLKTQSLNIYKASAFSYEYLVCMLTKHAWFISSMACA